MSADGLVFPLVPGRRVEGLPFGSMRSSRRGAGADLAGSRPYRPGDDVRRIDWRASARLSSARSTEEFLVLEHLTEEAAQAVLVVDRSPRMALFSDGFPWLRKPEALTVAGSMIADSAFHARCLVAYLDDADGEHPSPEKRAGSPFWREPLGPTEAWRIKEGYLAYPGFHAPHGSLGRLLEELAAPGRAPAPGTFVFLLSDFLAFPPEDAWTTALARGWDVVPVVIQDPTWEQSFPAVGGFVLPVVDPATGETRLVRLTRGEADERRRTNEARLASILERLAALSLDPVVLSSSDPARILEAFLGWSETRRQGARLPR